MENFSELFKEREEQSISILENKYCFFDLDGTLAEYRFNNRVLGDTGGGQHFHELLFGDVFIKSRPLKTMQSLLSKLDSDKIFVLGVTTTNTEINDKYLWLEKHYPMIKKENIIFVAKPEQKVQSLKLYSDKLGVLESNICFIDDFHMTIRLAEEAGFTSYHPTTFFL